MFSMPYDPYPVQKQFCDFISKALEDSTPSRTLLLELPTGSGKTLAALSPVLSFQASLGSHRAATAFFKSQQRTKRQATDEPQSTAGSDWSLPPTFFEKFGCNAANARKRSRRSVPLRSSDSSHPPPPCAIFVVCRTHAQIAQCVAEISKFGLGQKGSSTKSRPLKMTIIGSRDRYCIHPTVFKARARGALPNEGNNLGEICDKLVALGQCEPALHSSELGDRAVDGKVRRHGACCPQLRLWEIEDLVKDGVAIQGCPYYAARNIVGCVDVVLATYEYLLDPLIRHETKLESALGNHSIIIIDEAHNVPDVCRDALSGRFPSTTLSTAASEISPFTSLCESNVLSYPRSFKIAHWTLSQLFDFLQKFVQTVIEMVRYEPIGVAKKTSADSFLLRIATNCTAGDICLLEQKFHAAFRLILSLGVTFNPFNFTIFCLSQLKRLLVVVRFMLLRPSSFVLWIENECPATCHDPAAENALRIRCLDEGLAFNHLAERAFRTLLMSGTLAPLRSFARSLNVPAMQPSDWFEGGHVVDVPRQCRIVALAASAAGYGSQLRELRCTLQNYSSKEFFSALAFTIAHLLLHCSLVGGVLVFLPNYSLCEQMYGQVQQIIESDEQNQFSRITSFVEPRNSTAFRTVFTSYKNHACQGGGVAVFFAVFRGKISEGLDFADDMARMVICVGIPFRNFGDENVQLQRQFSGEEWYVSDAVRCINQSVGRCLRHISDYGSIVLLDCRLAFTDPAERPVSHLSKWIRQNLVSFNSLKPLTEYVGKFFAEMRFHDAFQGSSMHRNCGDVRPLQGKTANSCSVQKVDWIPPPQMLKKEQKQLQQQQQQCQQSASCNIPVAEVTETAASASATTTHTRRSFYAVTPSDFPIQSSDTENFDAMNEQLCADIAQKLAAEYGCDISAGEIEAQLNLAADCTPLRDDPRSALAACGVDLSRSHR